MKKTFLFVFLAPFMALIFSAILVYYLLFIWKYAGSEQYFVIKEGETFSRINTRLKNEELIPSTRIFYQYARFKNQLNCFKEGTYLLKSGQGIPEIITLFCEGKSITIAVTIPEGKNLYEIAQILEAHQILRQEDFKQKAFDPAFLEKMSITAPSAEGYLFPETYRFSPQSSAEKVLSTMIRLFQKKTMNINYQTSKLSPFEVLTMASIVEKETAIPSERKRVAGVFLNRLKNHMRLQSDPTTIYGIFEGFSGNLHKKDLETKTSYNTYKIDGLPPGPIANPSLSSIEAVLGPEEHSFLYFVSKNNGEHIFSTNYEDHRHWVDVFQKRK